MTYNTTYLVNATTLPELLEGIHVASDGGLGIGIAVLVFLVTMFAIKSRGYEMIDSLAAGASAHFFATVILFFFNAAEYTMVPIGYVITAGAMFAGILFYYVTQR